MKLAARVAVITGGARGIGFATAARLVRQGCSVGLWDLDAGALREAAAGLPGPGRVYTTVCDVTRAAEVYDAAARTREALGEVDILVNNAGTVQGGTFLSRPDRDWEQLIAVNLTALLYTTRAFLPGMIERDQGHIVNISSAAGTLGVADMAVYAATKWAVWGLTESLRHEMRNSGRRGVRLSTIHPSYVRTGLFEGARIPGIGGLIVPLLRDHDVVAAAIVEAALKRGRRVVMRPRSVRLAVFLRGVLPAPVFDAAVRLFGIHMSMAHWHGRGPDGKMKASPMSDNITSGRPIRNPATGEPVALEKRVKAADLERLVKAARAAQPAWAALTVRQRGAVVRRAAALVAARAEALAALVSSVTGKPRVDALATEVLPAALACRYYPRLARRALSAAQDPAEHAALCQQALAPPARALGRDRDHQPLELPARHPDARGGPVADRGQRRRAQGRHPVPARGRSPRRPVP